MLCIYHMFELLFSNSHIVITRTFPEDLTPLIRQQNMSTHAANRHKANPHTTPFWSFIEGDSCSTERLLQKK